MQSQTQLNVQLLKETWLVTGRPYIINQQFTGCGMACGVDLREVLVQVLSLSSDASVLHFAAASRRLRDAVEECRQIGSQGPWRHAATTWEVSGLWRFLGLSDLKKIPKVTLCCETEFQHEKEVLAFFKAAKGLAADTIDGHVIFSKFTFDATDASHLFFGEEEFMTDAHETVKFLIKGYQVECSIDGHLWWDESTVPTINLWVHENSDVPKNLDIEICCSSIVSPELRLIASCRDNMSKELDLDAKSPFTELVRTSRPLPMLLGVKGFKRQNMLKRLRGQKRGADCLHFRHAIDTRYFCATCRYHLSVKRKQSRGGGFQRSTSLWPMISFKTEGKGDKPDF